MTQTLILKDWGLKISAKAPLFVILAIRIVPVEFGVDDHEVYIAVALADTEQEAIEMIPEQDRDEFDMIKAYDLISLIGQAHTLNQTLNIVDAAWNKE